MQPRRWTSGTVLISIHRPLSTWMSTKLFGGGSQFLFFYPNSLLPPPANVFYMYLGCVCSLVKCTSVLCVIFALGTVTL